MSWWTSFRDSVLAPIATIAAVVIAGPMVGAALLGEAVAAGTVSTLMATAVGSGIVSGTITAARGGSASDVLKSAVLSGAGSYIGGSLADALKGSGVSAEALEAANKTADPVAALNASQGWTQVDIPYLQSIGATPEAISSAIATNLANFKVAATPADLAVESFAKTSVTDPYHYDAMVKAHVDPTSFVRSGADQYGNPLYAFKDASGELVSSQTLFQTPDPGYSFNVATGQQVLTDPAAAETALRARITSIYGDIFNNGSIVTRGADGWPNMIIDPQQAMTMVRDLQAAGQPIPDYLQSTADAMASGGTEVTTPTTTTTTPVEPVRPVGTEVTTPIAPNTNGVNTAGNNVMIPNADGSFTNPETGEITYPNTGANGVNTAGNNVGIPNADGSVTNPETGEITWPDANTDTSVNPDGVTRAPVEDLSGTALPGTNNPLGEGNPDLLGAITRLGSAGLEALGLGGLTPGQIATMVAAGVLAPAVIAALTGQQPATGPAGYEPLGPAAPSTYVPPSLARPGLNPGLITPVKAYDTTNPVQSQYSWEVKPYMQTAADLANYNINSATQAWGLQQPRAPVDINELIRGAVNPQTRAAAQGTIPTPFAEPATGPVAAAAPVNVPIDDPGMYNRIFAPGSATGPARPLTSLISPIMRGFYNAVGDAVAGQPTTPGGSGFVSGGAAASNGRTPQDFMQSSAYQDYVNSQIGSAGTMDMYNSPYFGLQSSGSYGQGLDQAYQNWAGGAAAPQTRNPMDIYDDAGNVIGVREVGQPSWAEMPRPPVPVTPTSPPPNIQPPRRSVDTGLQPVAPTTLPPATVVWDPVAGQYVDVASTSGSQNAVQAPVAPVVRA